MVGPRAKPGWDGPPRDFPNEEGLADQVVQNSAARDHGRIVPGRGVRHEPIVNTQKPEQVLHHREDVGAVVFIKINLDLFSVEGVEVGPELGVVKTPTQVVPEG